MEAYVKYGGETLSFRIPENWKLVKVATPAVEPEAVDEQGEIRRSLSNPIGTPRLEEIVKPNCKVAIAVDDKTRPTPAWKIMPELLNRLNNAGVPDGNIRVVMALGLHPRQTEGELERKLSREVLSRVEVVNHNPDYDLEFLGYTSRKTPIYINRRMVEADVKIGVGSISPHPAAGYTGGPKIVLPGVSGRETIYRNHSLYREKDSAIGRLDGNPLVEDNLEAARKLGLNFIVNAVLDSEGRILKMFSGDVAEAHRAGVNFFDSIYKVNVPEMVDVSIVSSHPADIDLYQSWKALFPASMVTRPGGVVILVSPCFEGVSDELYEALTGLRLHEAEVEDVYRMAVEGKISNYVFGLAYYKLRTVIEGKHVVIVTKGIPGWKLEAMGFKHAETVNEAINMASSMMGKAKTLVAPFGAKTLLSLG